ncbi:DUF2147 domain-containing protein [Leptothrix discophora]|uniref:DUF2147 domain-containing protein n=1 Tax=Leptothrix discophora TaxID=89 RepID=A0ABT9G3I6_LEPDI|nr:DUF2147 domain-containing protein [Leptothrix discophora]MDP4301048.1 DUF2147 domain-containing protein [Leptothrix discophora]
MNTHIPKIAATLAMSLLGGLALAQSSPAGLWRTIDDDGRTEKSLVRISDSGGTFSGKVEKVADPARQDARCDACSDARKGQPVLGMTILQGVKASTSEAGLWDGGEILDPNNGKTYKVRMKLVNDGKTMELRAYIGLPLIGRTQTWQRVE